MNKNLKQAILDGNIVIDEKIIKVEKEAAKETFFEAAMVLIGITLIIIGLAFILIGLEGL